MINLYGKIEPEFLVNIHENTKKVVLFDPSEIYSRITFDKFKRRQSFGIGTLFPNEKGFCACGCGEALTGRQTRWKSENCQKVPLGVLYVLNGDTDYIGRLMQTYLPHRCSSCDCENYLIESKKIGWGGREIINHSASGLQVDHILAVQNGGSGTWLGNYQFLCHRCHSVKTKRDNLEKRNRLAQGSIQNSLFPAKIVNL
jgi:hypothetical protein